MTSSGKFIHLTNWVEAIPLKEVTQTKIIDFIEEHIVHRFGIPQTLTTDRGTMFTGRRVLEYVEIRQIKMITSNAQVKGQVEAVNKSIIALIKKNVSRRPRNWHNLLSQLLWAY